MKFTILEKVFGSFQGGGGQTYFVYLNPTSQELRSQEDSKDNRGIIDDDGNLYMEALWIQDKDINYSSLIHDRVLRFLQNKGKLNNIDLDWFTDPKSLNNALFVQRYRDTFDFYMAESYEIEIFEEDVERILKLAKMKNPYLNFSIGNIRNMRFS